MRPDRIRCAAIYSTMTAWMGPKMARMARIRTIKPEFFLHEELRDLEEEVGLPVRLAFIGLWCHSDKHGRFHWSPRRLKAGILPYDDVDFVAILDALHRAGFIARYACPTRDGRVPHACPTRDGRVNDDSVTREFDHENGCFGFIPSFKKHQIINNREADSDIPPPPSEFDVNTSRRNTLTRAPRVPHACPTRARNLHAGREGKGREGKGTISNTRETENESGSITQATEKPIVPVVAVAEKPPESPPIPAGFRPWDCDGSIDRLAEELGRIRSAAGFGPAPVQVSRLERGLYSDARCDISDEGLIAIWRWMWTSNEQRAAYLRKGKFITFRFLLEKFAEYADVSAQPPPPDRMELLRLRNEAERAKAAAQ